MTLDFLRAKIESMVRELKFCPGVFVLLAVLSIPAFAQGKKPAQDQSQPTEQPADQDANRNSDSSIYLPPGPARSVEVGNFYLRKREYKGALSRFQEAASQDPGYAPAFLGLGKVYEHMGLRQKALDAYRHYLDILPSAKDAQEAKKVQSAVARLERELKGVGQGRRNSRPKSGAPDRTQ